MPGMVKDPRTGLMRMEPALRPGQMKTYGITAPRRQAVCNEPGVDCPLWETGWHTICDTGTELGRAQAEYLRNRSGRRFTETRTSETLVSFYFYPHQICFTAHVLAAADEKFYRRSGDWRGNPDGDRYLFDRPADWVDDFANTQNSHLAQIQRG